MAKLLRAYNDFRGGINKDTAPDNLLDNELEIGLNIRLSERGGLTKRGGTDPFNAVSYAAQVERLIEWPRNDGTKVLLAVVGSTLSKIADGGTKTDIQSLYSVNIGHFFFQDNFYFTDGDQYYVYNGTTCTTVTPDPATDNDLAPVKRSSMLLWHPSSFRFFAAGDTNDPAALYYSEPNKPDYFKNTSKMYPTTGDGPIKGLALFGQSVLIFYQNSVWAWTGSDPATATWNKLAVGQGTVANRSINLTPNSLTFLGQGGVFSLSPAVLGITAVMQTGEEYVRDASKNKVRTVINSIVHPNTCCGVYDKTNGLYLLAYGDDAANPRNNKILVLDWDLLAFTIDTGIQANDFCQRANGDLLIASSNYILKVNPNIYKDFDVSTGTYKAINMQAVLKNYDLGYPFHQKKVFSIFVGARQYQTMASTLSVLVEADYSEAAKTISFQADPDEALIWGEAWGSVWGYADYVNKEFRLNGKGNRFQITLSNNIIDEIVTIYGVAFEYKLRKPRGVRV